MHDRADRNNRSYSLVLIKVLAITAFTAALAFFFLSSADQTFLSYVQQIHELNHSLFRPESQLSNLLLTGLFIEAPIVFATYYVAFKSHGFSKAFITFQMFVLSYFCQWMAWSIVHLQTSPVSILMGLTAAFLCGHFDGQMERDREESMKNKLILALKEKELKEAHLQMVKQDEADRRILASDLHDQVLNDLKSLRVAVQEIKSHSNSNNPNDLPDKLIAIETIIDQTTAQVREVMENLTPSVLENLGLASAIGDLLRRSSNREKFKSRFKNDSLSLDKLSKIRQLLIFRTVQEALSNIAKHAEADKVEITVKEDQNELVISILDDGRGISSDQERGQSRGLRYMRQRADLIGAHIAWLPGKDDKGCLVEIKIDLKESQG